MSWGGFLRRSRSAVTVGLLSVFIAIGAAGAKAEYLIESIRKDPVKISQTAKNKETIKVPLSEVDFTVPFTEGERLNNWFPVLYQGERYYVHPRFATLSQAQCDVAAANPKADQDLSTGYGAGGGC